MAEQEGATDAANAQGNGEDTAPMANVITQYAVSYTHLTLPTKA